MTHTSTEQPEALPNDGFLQLWQAYCDKKSECDDLRERIAELEASQAQRVPLSDEAKNKLLREWSYSQFTGKGDFLDGVDAAERAHCITQEKQG
jgi:hypothetical protein